MNYSKDVSVIVEDNRITVVGDNGVEDVIVFLHSEDGKSKIVDKRNYNSPQNDTIIFKGETFLERLYSNALKEIEQLDKKIVAEAFRKDKYLDRIKNYSFRKYLNENFKKKSKSETFTEQN
jgi:hypothetical protein